MTKTKLGEPDKIEPCQSFDSLAPRARYKDYYWGDIYSDNFCHVTVDYVRHFSKQVDDFEIYPSDNGYVSYVSYYDPETGETYTFDELDIIEQW